MSFLHLNSLARTCVTLTSGSLVVLWSVPRLQEYRRQKNMPPFETISAAEQAVLLESPLVTRSRQIEALKSGQQYDVLVIGGGATGTGVALDSCTRGLKTALIERLDFSSGTSSRSTKLLHGGVRYLQKAILGFDREQFKMVKEALAERANLIDIAPHLAYPLPIMLPVYRYWQLPWYWVGLKAYDLVAGRQMLKSSYVLSKAKALEQFPMLKQKSLVGAIVYYDGQHDDARMCVSIAITAARHGATVANHVSCEKLLKTSRDGKEVISGATLKDMLTGETWDVNARCVINATGPFTDSLRQMDDPLKETICQPSAGVHVVLPAYYSPVSMGLLDPATSDGRVIFFLPWQNSTIAGTTDSPCGVTDNPRPTEKDVSFILNEVKHYLSPDVNVRRGDVLAAWAGIRPLVLNPKAKDTQSIARNHIIEISDSGLVTIAGGKWTTYRAMAEETVDAAVETCDLSPTRSCVTRGLKLDGAEGWSPTQFIRLIQDFGLDTDVAQHLSHTYGSRAYEVAKRAQLTGQRWPVVGKRLHSDYPYIEAEVEYAISEYAATVVDVVARRTRLGFLNVHATQEALPRILEIMARELGWSKQRQRDELSTAVKFLEMEMGLNLKSDAEKVPINFTKEEITMYIQRFQSLDRGAKGFINLSDLRQHFKNSGEKVTEDQLHSMLSEVDVNKNAQVDLGEFLQLMSAMKTGAIGTNRFARTAELAAKVEKIPVSRSGGGL